MKHTGAWGTMHSGSSVWVGPKGVGPTARQHDFGPKRSAFGPSGPSGRLSNKCFPSGGRGEAQNRTTGSQTTDDVLVVTVFLGALAAPGGMWPRRFPKATASRVWPVAFNALDAGR